MRSKATRAKKANLQVRDGAAEQREGVRLLLTSTRFIASLFWLTIIVAAMVFVLPYSERSESPVFYGFVVLSILVFFGHRYFPYDGYHPVAYFMLLLATDALIAVMVYLTGGSESSISLLFLAVIIFSSAYFELLETMLMAAVTCAVYFLPLAYETVNFETLKGMAIAVPIYFIIALGGFFVISKAREQEREKQALNFLYDRADTKRRELSTLYAVSLKFASTLDEGEMLDILLANTNDLVPNDAIAISMLETPERLRVRAYRGMEEGTASLLVAFAEDNPLYVSASAVLPVILRDSGEDPRFRSYLEGAGFSSMIAVPLFASSSVTGVMCCFAREEGAFDDDAARILLTLSSEAALALEKASLYQTTLEDKKKIETIINSLTDGLMVLDREGKLALANPFIASLMDVSDEDYDRHLAEIVQGSRAEIRFKDMGMDEALDRVLATGESVKNEMLIDTEPPTVFQVLWVPLYGVEGGTAGAIILLHDITDFVELDRMKSDFISIVSHELKTPLTSIKGFIRLMAAERVGPVTEKQSHYLEVVQKQTEALTTLINDLLDLSRIEAGIIEVSQEPLVLAEVIWGVVQQLENLAHEKGISLQVELAEDLPMVSGDSARLGQVFMNLIHNAIKFTPQGGDVMIKAVLIGEHCLVKISDDGIGISAQDLPKIFDKFYQVDSSSTRRQSGTGLGLPISKQLVTAHGGEMWVNSTKGKGTTVSIILPLHLQQTASQPRKGSEIGEAATR